VPNKDVMLKEWEQRYESYRQYRAQYLHVLGIVGSIWILAASIVADKALDPAVALLLGCGSLLMGGGAVIAHFIAMRAITRLAARLSELEQKLEMQHFDTTRTLRLALWVTAPGVLVATLASMAFLTYRAFHGLAP